MRDSSRDLPEQAAPPAPEEASPAEKPVPEAPPALEKEAAEENMSGPEIEDADESDPAPQTDSTAESDPAPQADAADESDPAPQTDSADENNPAPPARPRRLLHPLWRGWWLALMFLGIAVLMGQPGVFGAAWLRQPLRAFGGAVTAGGFLGALPSLMQRQLPEPPRLRRCLLGLLIGAAWGVLG